MRLGGIGKHLRVHADLPQRLVQPVRAARGTAVQFTRYQVEYLHTPSEA